MSSESQNPNDAQSQIEPRILGSANLSFFLNDRLLPILQEFTTIESYPQKQSNFLRAELLESFLWLHLGVQIGHFPLSLSRRAVYEYFPMILDAYEVISETPFFQTAYTPPLRTIWDSEFSGRQDLFASARLWKEAAPSEASSLFQTSSVFANEFVQDLETRPFIQAITLSTEAEWEQAVKYNKPLADVERNEANDDLPDSAHWTGPAVFSTIDYLRTVRQFNLAEQTRNSSQEFATFRQRLREIQQWRLNFADLTYRLRFQAAAQTVAKQFKSMEESQVEHFLNEIYDLMTDWGAPLKQHAASA
jgi:hypothetical protein